MKSFILILIAALFLGSAAYLGNMLLLGAETEIPVDPPAVPEPKVLALRLTDDGATGDILSRGMLEWRPLPKSSDPRRFLTDATVSLDGLEGAALTLSVRKGKFLEVTHIVRPGEPGYMKALLGEGMRARPVDISNLDKFGDLRPGDHVDLTLIYRVPGQASRAGETSVRTLLENARVIDIDGVDKLGSVGTKSTKRTLVLALSPKDVERVSLAEVIGELSVALSGSGSSPKSGKPIEPTAFSASDLFPDLKPRPLPLFQDSARDVRIMRGGDVTVQTVTVGKD